MAARLGALARAVLRGCAFLSVIPDEAQCRSVIVEPAQHCHSGAAQRSPESINTTSDQFGTVGVYESPPSRGSQC
jgi:hypothetical protein